MPRGLAALCVMLLHYSTMFIVPSGIVHISHTQPIAAQTAPMAWVLFEWLGARHINLGLCGIAIFFLISGFVIPVTLERTGPLQYVIRRVFRVYPLYLAGLCSTVAVVYVYTSATGAPYLPPLKDFVGNALLIRDWWWLPSIDGINWTLEIELKFYILCGLLAAVSGLRSAWLLGSVGAACMMFALVTVGAYDTLLTTNLARYKLLHVVSTTATFVPFMLIGTCLFNFYRGYWRLTQCLVTGSVLLCAFAANAGTGSIRHGAPSFIVSSVAGLVLFAGLFKVRDRLPHNRLLSWLSDISYPLYVVHGVIGYILITALHEWTTNSYVLIPVTSAIAIGFAYLLHRLVELPANNWGRRLARASAAWAAEVGRGRVAASKSPTL